MCETKKGFILNFKDEGDNSYLLEGLVYHENGKWNFRTADTYKGDGISVLNVNREEYVKASSTYDTTDGAETIQVQRAGLDGGGVFDAILIQDRLRNSLARINYLTDEEWKEATYIQVLSQEDAYGCKHSIVAVDKFLTAERNPTSEVVQKQIIEDIQHAVYIEMKRLSVMLDVIKSN